MPDQNLISYIQESLKLGSSKEQIQKALIDNGWKADVVDEGFKSLYDNVPTPSLTQTPATSPSSNTASQPSFIPLLEKYFTLIGSVGILISGILFFIYFSIIINRDIAIYIATYEVLLGIIESFILFILTKAFKINNSTYSKAIFFSGSIIIIIALIQLLDLLHIPQIIGGLLSIGLLVGSFILLIKLYLTTVGRGIALGITNIIVTSIIGLMLAFLFTLFGVFKIQSLFQGSNNGDTLKTEQSNSSSSLNTNREKILDNINEEQSNNSDSINQFAFNYYSKLKEKESGNIFFSPFSISSAFAMTYEGAKGQTAEEIQSVFYIPEDNNLRQTKYKNFFDEINKEDKKYQLSSVNSLWVQNDFILLNDYRNTIEEYYGGKAVNLNFKEDTEGSRMTINNSVADQTNNKIKDLIPPGSILPITKLVLTNAIYFKGEWVKQFNQDYTQEQNFETTNDTSVKAQIMQRTDDESIFNYAENNDLQILEMPYSGKELSMIFLLPKNNDLKELENLMTSKKLSEWTNGLEEQRVDVYIPKFKFESKYSMASDLQTMGMSTAFSDMANFSGISKPIPGEGALQISEAIHQAFIDVNEEGSEAAAATAIVMLWGSADLEESPRIPVFRADHPFIFLIKHNSTGNILFMGRVINPNL